MTTQFAKMFEGQDSKPVKCMVCVSFKAPDGHVFASWYDMAAKIDLDTINRNVTDGYVIYDMHH